MGELQSLPNIGKVTEELLLEAGIDTQQKLIEAGSRAAFLKIRKLDPTACLHMLYGLEGAVRGIKDKELSSAAKEELKTFYNETTCK